MRLIVIAAAASGWILPSGVSAAEARTPAPATRSCPQHGPGFVEVPGTATCIRIGGRVRAEAGTVTRRSARDVGIGTGAGARLSIDTRTDTSYGPVRSFVRFKAGDGSGPR